MSDTYLKFKPATDCFAYDNKTGQCTCLSVKRCLGKKCPFYKHVEKALEEAATSLEFGQGYEQNIHGAIKMMEENRAVN